MTVPWISLAQAREETDPDKVAPKVVVNVRKHPIGAEIVEVTAGSAAYPKELLRDQCERLGEYLHSPPRGLTVYYSGTDPKFKFLKANFAVDGLIDRDKGTIELQAIVRAFLGAPAPFAVDSLLITLEGEAPVDKQTLREYSSPFVILRANVSQDPKGLEYRVLVKSQDAEQVSIPNRFVETPAHDKLPDKKSQRKPDFLPAALLVVAGLAAIALVYFAVSGKSAPKSGSPGKRN